LGNTDRGGAPNRFNSLFGAARASELAGDREKAGNFYAQLVTTCARADSDRPELTAARRFLERLRPASP